MALIKVITIGLLFTILPYNSFSQIIITFAGNGSALDFGDACLATDAGISDPIGGCFDKSNNYYFADGISNKIKMVDTFGIIHLIAGSGSSGFSGDSNIATLAQLNFPNAIITDNKGNLYIADAGNNRIRKINKNTNIITTIAGKSCGSVSYSGDGGQSTDACLSDPNDICFDKFGNLYIAEVNNHVIRKIDTFGIISLFAGSLSIVPLGDGGLATNALINVPEGLVSDKYGNIFIADASTCRVRKVDTAGIISTIAGNGNPYYAGDNIPATDAQITPIKLAFDNTGLLYIADELNRRVFMIDSIGYLHCIAGDGLTTFDTDYVIATETSIYYPGGLAFDSCNNLYITDINHHRIRKVIFNTSCSISKAIILNENINNFFTFSPNPAHTSITIETPTEENELTICNPTGQVLLQRRYKGKRTEQNIENLPQSLYFIKVNNEKPGRFVKE